MAQQTPTNPNVNQPTQSGPKQGSTSGRSASTDTSIQPESPTQTQQPSQTTQVK